MHLIYFLYVCCLISHIPFHVLTMYSKAVANPSQGISFVGNENTDFFGRLNKLFMQSLHKVLRQMNIYTNTIVSKSELELFLEESKTLFPALWSIGRAIRGVHPTIARR